MKYIELIGIIFDDGFTGYLDNAGKIGFESEETLLGVEKEFYNLIATAPEMLELIKETVMVVEKSPSQELYPSIIRDMKEIIAKAEGDEDNIEICKPCYRKKVVCNC